MITPLVSRNFGWAFLVFKGLLCVGFGVLTCTRTGFKNTEITHQKERDKSK